MENITRTGRRSPATFPLVDVRGRSPGSEDLIHRLPERIAQWRFDGLALPYRCGGSTGIALRRGAHQFPVSPDG